MSDSTLSRLTRWGRDAARAVRDHADADLALMASMAALIELAGRRYPLDPGAQWRPGEPLKLLFAGYSGTRNTGADVRVEEMIRQVRHLLGDDHCDLSILTIDPASSRGYFRTVKQLHLPQVFPRFVLDAVHAQHGVIACEGSMFKSKFANALSTLMVGALGVACAENKLAVGYGGEAGAMDPALEALVRRTCRDALILCRNPESQAVLEGLGVPALPGTDTAWTFEAAPPSVGSELLRERGWDGRAPVVAICPIQAFWWPVKPDLLKTAAHKLTGAHERAHYSSVYFHRSGPEVDAAQERYLDALARGVSLVAADRSIFPVIVGMEQLDRGACEGLAERLGRDVPVLVSDEHDMYPLVSVLRRCSAVLSSRYHAIVCSMPGLVPSAGVTMDERIRNLMADRGTPELALEVDDPMLPRRVQAALVRLLDDPEPVRASIGHCVAANLERMGQMGQAFVDCVRARHPELPIAAELGGHGVPRDHLPPLHGEVRVLAAQLGWAE